MDDIKANWSWIKKNIRPAQRKRKLQLEENWEAIMVPKTT
jgi:hypothetical protein